MTSQNKSIINPYTISQTNMSNANISVNHVFENDCLNDTLCYDFDLPALRHSATITAVYGVAYAFVFIVGVIGNSFVVAVVVRSPRMRTVTNVFIANLAVADLLVNVICVPTNLIGHTLNAWILGWFICKAVAYLQGVSVSASINTLVAISVDRAMAICFPMRCQITSMTCKTIIVIIWLYSFTITLPWAIYFRLEAFGNNDDMQICTEKWPSKESGDLYFVLANGVMCYLLPLTIISVCYVLIWHKVWVRKLPGEGQNMGVALMMHRSKIKVIKMLLVVVVLFAFSWLPLYTIFARLKFGELSDLETRIIHVAAPVAQWLGASNSCINPILYAFFNNKFRAGFKAILMSRSCCEPLRLDATLRRPESIQMTHSFIGPKCATSFVSASKLSVRSTSSSDRSSRKSLVVKVSLDNQLKPKSPYSCLEHLPHGDSDESPETLRLTRNKYTNGSFASLDGLYNGEMTLL